MPLGTVVLSATLQKELVLVNRCLHVDWLKFDIHHPFTQVAVVAPSFVPFIKIVPSPAVNFDDGRRDPALLLTGRI